MKKRVIIIALIVGALSAIVLGLSALLFANRASTPDGFARKVGLRLPAYRVTRAEDNLGRTASAWTGYLFEIEFDEPLTDAFLDKVCKMKTCTREGDIYIIRDESPDDWECTIRMDRTNNTATLEYDFWDSLF
jgi:hypothetical protein